MESLSRLLLGGEASFVFFTVGPANLGASALSPTSSFGAQFLGLFVCIVHGTFAVVVCKQSLWSRIYKSSGAHILGNQRDPPIYPLICEVFHILVL